MPALPAPGPIVRVELLFDVGVDASALTRFFFNYTGAAPGITALTAFSTLINGYADDALPPLMHPDTTYLGCVLQDLGSDLGLVASFPESAVGSRDGDQLGADVCVLANYPIGRHYRGGKPRGYWPLGTSADLLDRQHWTTGFTGSCEDVLAVLLSEVNGSSSEGCTAGQQYNVSWYGPPNQLKGALPGRVRTVSTQRVTPLIDAITTVSVSPQLASQRRRNLRRR
jgi:hypothetical protein